MTDMIDIEEAEAQFYELLDRVASGEEIVITRAGTPMACLTEVSPQVAGIVSKWVLPDAVFDPLSESELARWE
jgi:prevent-host-death family protein